MSGDSAELTVWTGSQAASSWQGPGRLAPVFHRRWQAYWLYRRLLRQPGRLLVATAGTADLVSADWAARGVIPPRKLFLFVHWLNAKPSKVRRLAAIARRQPHVEILAPSPPVADFFRQCGFKATVVPYPLEAQLAREQHVAAQLAPASLAARWRRLWRDRAVPRLFRLRIFVYAACPVLLAPGFALKRALLRRRQSPED